MSNIKNETYPATWDNEWKWFNEEKHVATILIPGNLFPENFINYHSNSFLRLKIIGMINEIEVYAYLKKEGGCNE